ncbi:MAG TPA: hypothetical protein VF756_02100 [Thermoanaerobaculia bacterium]
MARKLRFIPEEGTLVEVTCRTIQSRMLLRPSPELNEILLGVLGRAQRLYGVGICGYSFLSTHYHLVLRVRDAEQLASFAGYFNSNVAREVARLTGWTDKIWSRRFDAILISNEEGAQVERLTYVLSNGVKEGLVARLEDWPGVHCVSALLTGQSPEGTWFNRTREYSARQRGEEIRPRSFAETEVVTLEQLPCWAHLSPESYRERIAGLVQTIEEDAAAERAQIGIEPLSPEAICRQDPKSQPRNTKKSPAPAFHAFTRRARKELWEMYGKFVAAFREAAEKLRSGDRNARFPSGSFPPHLPFVRDLPLALSPAG